MEFQHMIGKATVAACLSLACVVDAEAQSDRLIMFGKLDDEMHRVDLTDASSTRIEFVDGLFGFCAPTFGNPFELNTGLAWDPVDQSLIAASVCGPFEICLKDGIVLDAGNWEEDVMGELMAEGAIAIEPSTGDMFIADGGTPPDIGPNWLIRAPRNGQEEFVGVLPDDISGMVFLPDGRLIGIDGVSGRIYRIDTSDASGELLATLAEDGIPFDDDVTGLAHDPVGGMLYTAFDDRLYRIDPSDWSATLVGMHGLGPIAGMAILPVDPGVSPACSSLYPDPGTIIEQDLTLVAENPSRRAFLGASVAIEGQITGAGASLDSERGNNAGAAFLFDASTGAQLSKFFAADTASGDAFGYAIDIQGDRAVVGTRSGGAGKAYLFDIGDPETPVQTRALHQAAPVPSGAQLGMSVAIDGGLIAVGASADENGVGAVYLFDALSGDFLRQLVPSAGDSNSLFGFPVAIDEGIVAGASFNDSFVAIFDGATGEELATVSTDWRPRAVAIDGDRLVVGMPLARDMGFGSTLGEVALYDISDPETPVLQEVFVANDRQPNDGFGAGVAIEDDLLVAGAPGDGSNFGGDGAFGSGSLYVFDIESGEQLAKLLPDPDAAGLEHVGELGVVAIDQGVIVGGARMSDLGSDFDQGDTGAAFVFNAFAGDPTCPADLTGPGGDGVPDGALTADDFFFYLGLFAEGDLAADLTGPGGDGEPDGDLTADDFFFYLGLFAEGCP